MKRKPTAKNLLARLQEVQEGEFLSVFELCMQFEPRPTPSQLHSRIRNDAALLEYVLISGKLAVSDTGKPLWYRETDDVSLVPVESRAQQQERLTNKLMPALEAKYGNVTARKIAIKHISTMIRLASQPAGITEIEAINDHAGDLGADRDATKLLYERAEKEKEILMQQLLADRERTIAILMGNRSGPNGTAQPMEQLLVTTTSPTRPN